MLWADFQENRSCSTAFSPDMLQRISAKSVNKCGKYGLILMSVHSWSLAFTAPIFMKLTMIKCTFFNHVFYRIYRSRTKNVQITAIASLTLLRKALNSEINMPLCWSSQLPRLGADWHNFSVLQFGTFTALLHVSAKLCSHRQAVYISLQRKCALAGGLSCCKQWICSCKTDLLFFILTIHFTINTNPKYII